MKMHNPPHPGEIIKDAVPRARLGLSVTDAAKALGVSRKTLSSILNGRAGISPEMAVRLSLAFDTTAESWLNQQVQVHIVARGTQSGRVSVSIDSQLPSHGGPGERTVSRIAAAGDYNERAVGLISRGALASGWKRATTSSAIIMYRPFDDEQALTRAVALSVRDVFSESFGVPPKSKDIHHHVVSRGATPRSARAGVLAPARTLLSSGGLRPATLTRSLAGTLAGFSRWTPVQSPWQGWGTSARIGLEWPYPAEANPRRAYAWRNESNHGVSGRVRRPPVHSWLRVRVKDVLDLLAARAERAKRFWPTIPYLEPDDITAALEFASRPEQSPNPAERLECAFWSTRNSPLRSLGVSKLWPFGQARRGLWAEHGRRHRDPQLLPAQVPSSITKDEDFAVRDALQKGPPVGISGSTGEHPPGRVAPPHGSQSSRNRCRARAGRHSP